MILITLHSMYLLNAAPITCPPACLPTRVSLVGKGWALYILVPQVLGKGAARGSLDKCAELNAELGSNCLHCAHARTFLLCWKLLDEQSYRATETESYTKARLGVPKPPASLLTCAGRGSLKATLFLRPHLCPSGTFESFQHLLLQEPELTPRVTQGL